MVGHPANRQGGTMKATVEDQRRQGIAVPPKISSQVMVQWLHVPLV
jgi:hypothetical protein